MFTFQTGRSFTSEGFVANGSIEPEGEAKARLIITVQSKKGFSWGAGDRMTEKFYPQVADELAGESQQKSAVKAPENAVAVPEAKAVPVEPSMTKPAGVGSSAASPSSAEDKGKISGSSTPDGAAVYVDDAFVCNAPATLKLSSAKRTVKISQPGYKDWSKEVPESSGSEVGLKATRERNQARLGPFQVSRERAPFLLCQISADQRTCLDFCLLVGIIGVFVQGSSGTPSPSRNLIFSSAQRRRPARTIGREP
jgi:hypothetical protein